MSKRILLKSLPGVDRGALSAWTEERLREPIEALLREQPGARAKLAYSHPRPPLFSVPSISREPLTMVSLWDAEEGPALASLRRLLEQEEGELGEHEVEDSTPRDYDKSWPDGELSPGAILLTLFSPAPGLGAEEFLRRWQEEHTPLALSIHPLWRYERNRVLRTLSGAAWGGIVEEHARERSELVRPWRFFGSPLRMLPNMIKVGLHARTFLDLWGVRNHLLVERWLRS